MAERVRVASSRKRAATRRSAKAKKKPARRLGIFALAGLAALILGFLAKRVMIPSAIHYIQYRPPDQPPPANPGASEQLTPDDSRALNAIIKSKDK